MRTSVADILSTKHPSPQGTFCVPSPVTKEIYISYLEAYHHSSYEPNIVCHGTVINKAERYLKLKNYNHE